MRKIRFGDERDHMEKPKCTMAPRTRPGATYPGGKHYRKAMARLASRVANMPTGKGKKVSEGCYTKPGSMTK